MIRAIKNNLNMTGFLKSPAVRKMPWRVSFEFFKLLQGEKIVFVGGKRFSNGFIPEFPSIGFERFAGAMSEAAKGNFIPQSLVISVTNECNYKCWHCYNKYNKGKELSLDEIKKIIDFFQKKGIFGIFLAGGEPLLRKDIVQIVEYASKNSVVRMESTGYGLTEKKIRELKNAGLSAIKISLDHFKKEKVDEMRGYEGAFEVALEAIKNAKRAGIFVSSVIVLSREMLYSGQFQTYMDFVEKFGVDEIMVFQPKPAGSLVKADGEVLFNDKDRDEIFKLHKKVNKKGRSKLFCLNYFEDSRAFGCNAGSTNFYVDAVGNFAPCPVVSLSLGNIREEEPEIIFERFKKYFSQPTIQCLSFACQEQIKNHFSGKLPLEKDVSEKILKTVGPSSLPGFYKKITKK